MAIASGGSIKIIRGYEGSSRYSDSVILGVSGNGQNFASLDVTSLQGDEQAALNDLCTVYGTVTYRVPNSFNEFYSGARRFTTADIFTGSASQLFARVGLCQGITQVLDEEESGIIATGVFNNGKFYLFGIDDNGVTRAATNVVGKQFDGDAKSLAEMLADNQNYFNASVLGYDKSAVDQLLGERGVKTVWLEGEGLHDYVTESWIKTMRVSEVYINQ